MKRLLPTLLLSITFSLMSGMAWAHTPMPKDSKPRSTKTNGANEGYCMHRLDGNSTFCDFRRKKICDANPVCAWVTSSPDLLGSCHSTFDPNLDRSCQANRLKTFCKMDEGCLWIPSSL
ncbi:hypothetical protein GW916_03115 [bacterium]|nr:hypothetical protein [bacterium]